MDGFSRIVATRASKNTALPKHGARKPSGAARSHAARASTDQVRRSQLLAQPHATTACARPRLNVGGRPWQGTPCGGGRCVAYAPTTTRPNQGRGRGRGRGDKRVRTCARASRLWVNPTIAAARCRQTSSDGGLRSHRQDVRRGRVLEQGHRHVHPLRGRVSRRPCHGKRARVQTHLRLPIQMPCVTPYSEIPMGNMTAAAACAASHCCAASREATAGICGSGDPAHLSGRPRIPFEPVLLPATTITLEQ